MDVLLWLRFDYPRWVISKGFIRAFEISGKYIATFYYKAFNVAIYHSWHICLTVKCMCYDPPMYHFPEYSSPTVTNTFKQVMPSIATCRNWDAPLI